MSGSDGATAGHWTDQATIGQPLFVLLVDGDDHSVVLAGDQPGVLDPRHILKKTEL